MNEREYVAAADLIYQIELELEKSHSPISPFPSESAPKLNKIIGLEAGWKVVHLGGKTYGVLDHNGNTFCTTHEDQVNSEDGVWSLVQFATSMDIARLLPKPYGHQWEIRDDNAKDKWVVWLCPDDNNNRQFAEMVAIKKFPALAMCSVWIRSRTSSFAINRG